MVIESTSTFINHLFDMSDVERLFIGDNSNVSEDPHFTVSNESQAKTASKLTSKVMDFHTNLPIEMNSGVDIIPLTDTTSDKSTKSSEFSYLNYTGDVEVDNVCAISNEKCVMEKDLTVPLNATSSELQEVM